SKVVVSVGEIMSSIFKTTTGVKQGGPLSPLLFAIYVEELIELLEELKIGVDVLNVLINCILFADDILILANSEDELNELLKIVESYGVQNDIKFNHDKTQFKIFGDKMSKSEQHVRINFQGEQVKRVSSIKYLGVYLDEKLDERLNLNKRKNAYLCGFNKFKRLGIQDLNVSTEIKLYYYKTYIRPLLFYGFEVIRLNKTQTKKLQILESNLIKSMFGVKKHKRSSKLLKACNVDSVKTLVHEHIGNLKEFTVGRDETLVELVQEALESLDEENESDREEVRKVKQVLQKDGKNRRDELNIILDVNYSHVIKNSLSSLKLVNYKLVTLTTDHWANSTCTCRYFLKNFHCFHIIALAVSQKLVEMPIRYFKTPFAPKAKAGRKANAKKCLEKQ
ncbi:unnamed protein product, partial [Brachionus calyciflorus]